MKKKELQDLSNLEFPDNIAFAPLDAWQKEVLDYDGNIAIRSGRQVGKTAIMAKKAAKTAVKRSGWRILVSSASERQAMYIFERIKLELQALKVNVYDKTPTARLIKLKNGSEIYCLPTGQTGDLIRGLTLNVWIPDEAAYIPPAVYAAVTPMLWIAKNNGNGWIWALSTPKGKEGKFFDLFSNPEFKTWHISAEQCERIPKVELERWKKEYTRMQYAQEVLGEFLDEIARLFSDELIEKCMQKDLASFAVCSKFLGVDVARYGGDENAFVICEEYDGKYRVTFSETTERKGINETFSKITDLESKHKFKKILVDDAGVGGGLTDFLIEKYHDKVVGINNAQRSISSDKKKKKRLLKEDIYSNALMLMEQGKILIAQGTPLFHSLASMLFEYDEQGNLKIYGRDSHLSEAFVRACWGAKRKGLNLWASSKSNVARY